MTLIKYNREVPNVENRSFSTLLDRFFNESVGGTRRDAQYFAPQVDIAETKESFEISVAAPGMKKSDFKVNVDSFENHCCRTISQDRVVRVSAYIGSNLSARLLVSTAKNSRNPSA